MAEGKQREQWNHTAALLAQLENTAFGKKRPYATANSYHPFAKELPKRRLSREESIQRLNSVIKKQKKKKDRGARSEERDNAGNSPSQSDSPIVLEHDRNSRDDEHVG